MNLISIPVHEEPDCLKGLIYPQHTFDPDLQGDCKKEVQNKLSYLQNGFCAYCEQKLKGIYIEHYYPISTHPHLQLNWDNFLGVCSGIFWEHKPYARSCSPFRGNVELTLDPRILTHVNTIYYDDDLRIRSTSTQLDLDLEILNLNSDKLLLRRDKKFNEMYELFFYEDNKSGEYIKASSLKAISYLKSNPEEFSRCLIYAFQKLHDSF